MKVAPVLRALATFPVKTCLVHTGQHYDESMSGVFLNQLGIPQPDAHLGAGSGSHGAQTARVLEAFESYLLRLENPPAGVVVVGDVNSTLACALAAVKLNIPVAHIEAGLRSFDRSMPEEINRVVTDAVCSLLFASEPSGVENLWREGIAHQKIKFVGNVMIDTLARELPAARQTNLQELAGVEAGRYALVTLHRPANVDDAAKLAQIVQFLLNVPPRVRCVFPVHPRTRSRLDSAGLWPRIRESKRIRVLEPLGYRENMALMAAAKFVLTDSGGMQEETSYLGIPCLTLRPNTERPATVELGTNTLVGDDLGRASTLIGEILEGSYKKGGEIPLWDGRASERITAALMEAWRLA